MRYFIHFSYDGTAYHGWQVQPNANTVQAELNRALSTILRTDVETTGAGRTDAGVHASHMVAHFDVPEIADPAETCRRLARLLPADIAVERIVPVPAGSHARFDARARTYHYYIYTRKSPFLRHYAAHIPFTLDFAAMNEAASCLFQQTDFTSFSKTHTDVKTNNCRVTSAHWVEVEDGLWRFEITADRFLRGMVRAIVGTLLDVGRGRLSVEDFRRVIERRDRSAASDSVPANALFLVDVSYDGCVFPS